MSKKSAGELTSALLLDFAAAMVASDRPFHAPSMERGRLASVVSDLARFGIVPAAQLAEDVAILRQYVEAAWSKCEDRHASRGPECGQADILSIALMAMIALDQAISQRFVDRANRSRHFKRRLQGLSDTETRTPGERLLQALKNDAVRETVVATGLLNQEEIARLAADMDLRSTRSLLQSFLRAANTAIPIGIEAVDDDLSEVEPEVAPDPVERAAAIACEPVEPEPYATSPSVIFDDAGAEDFDSLNAQIQNLASGRRRP